MPVLQVLMEAMDCATWSLGAEGEAAFTTSLPRVEHIDMWTV